jgi:hypothetical protein
MVLYALGILVAVMAAILVKTTAIDNNSLTKAANLTGFNPLTVAPIANQTGNTGEPVAPVAPVATVSQVTPFPVITWTATGLPAGVTISHSSGLLTGTPSLAGTYQVTITAMDSTHPPTYGSTSFNWFIGNMAPTITQVVPIISQGAGGIRVVITGREFIDASSVKFGNVPAGGITVNGAGTRITVFAPPQEAGTVNVSVTALGGTSAPVPADQFTYTAPTLAILETPSGPAIGGTRVRLIGTGLAGASSVSFGGVPSVYFSVQNNGTSLMAIAPAGTPGTVPIVVVTPGGTVSTSGGDNFTYVPTAVVTAKSPTTTVKHAK